MKITTLSLLIVGLSVLAANAQTNPPLSDRIEGLLVGSLIGDAAGGPHEFQTRRADFEPDDEPLNEESLARLAEAFQLVGYDRGPEPYAHWIDHAPPGTVTDDSRFKILFFKSLARNDLTRSGLAREILAWHSDTTSMYGSLPASWLDEFAGSSRWVLGMSEEEGALPPERAWGGIPTMAGQMPFLPIAALHPGRPSEAYRAVWDVDFLDNGIGRDLNAALVAGLSAALAPDATWSSMETAIRSTDPYRFAEVPWVPRSVDVWLDFAHKAAERAEGIPTLLFEILETEVGAVTWWEAWVPMTVVFACAELANHDPLATMQLILSFGHDTDSYLQVAGALFGALHGTSAFPEEMRATVAVRLEEDYGVKLADWLSHIERFRGE